VSQLDEGGLSNIRTSPLSGLRRDYSLKGLRRSDLVADPLSQFAKWFEEMRVQVSQVGEVARDINAMSLATVGANGRPSARIVLLKGVDERGFIFFTNYLSRKGRELGGNSGAALVFYWPELERQVCVSGTVTKISDSESEDYFASRPRGSRLAAWASHQSESVAGRETLEEEWKRLEAKYPGETVPKPPHWGGYVVAPDRIEFWQGRPSRLHDRFVYEKLAAGRWKIERLAP
jgi:pyridoxamine 5'-phosphate oxidase